MVGTLTESLEDYLEIIFLLVHKHKVARVRDIARAKAVKNSSVTSALQRLAKEGLVEYRAREFVNLTEEGREFAFRVHQRHKFLKRFFVDLLQVDPETAEQDACSIEHSISVETLERIIAFAEFISYCPKVDKDLVREFRDCWLQGTKEPFLCKKEYGCGIWKERKSLSSELGIVRVTELSAGDRGYITRIIGPEAIRRSLIQRGILPAMSVHVKQPRADGSYDLLISDEEVHLKRDEAPLVYIWVAKRAEAVPRKVKPRVMTLSDLTPGRSFRVKRLTAKGELRQRLLDMGFIKGARGMLLREALLRDPIEIELGEYLLSLRRAEAMNIEVEEVAEPVPAEV